MAMRRWERHMANFDMQKRIKIARLRKKSSAGGLFVLYSAYFARSSLMVSPRILMPFSMASSELLE